MVIMSAFNPSQALEQEEHIFILEWGDEWARLLYALCQHGKVLHVDGFRERSCGVQNGVPMDEELASATIRKLMEQCQTKYHLLIQTIFVLIKSGGKLAYRVPEAKPYLNFLEKERQGTTPISSAHLKGIPHHCDLFDAFDSEDDAFRYAFALPSSMRENIQHSLIKADCFAEGFLSLPRIGAKARSQNHPGLVLGIFYENSIMMVSKGNDLVFYREFPFCLSMAIEKIQNRLQINKDRAQRMIQWITNPPNAAEFDQGHPDDQALFMSKDFGLVKDDIADELDHLAISIRDDLIHCGTWELGFDNIYLLGEGQAFYHHFTFLRDILPFEPLPLPVPHREQFAEGFQAEEFAALIRLIETSLQLRTGHRIAIAASASNLPKKWLDRLIGR